jgi:hypothetical protein
MSGFTWKLNITGENVPNIKEVVVANDEVFTWGEMLNLETGEADAGASGDTAFLGPAQESLNNADDGLTVKVIVNPDAVYEVVDNNARLMGATLDLAAGGLGVTTSSNADFIVYETSTATEPTLVTWNGNSWLDLS